MPALELMLASPVRTWPVGEEWVMQPKCDGFRLVVRTFQAGAVRAWSRHGTDLSGRLGTLLDPLVDLPSETLIEAELVALSQRAGAVSPRRAGRSRASARSPTVACDCASTPSRRRHNCLAAVMSITLAVTDIPAGVWSPPHRRALELMRHHRTHVIHSATVPPHMTALYCSQSGTL